MVEAAEAVTETHGTKPLRVGLDIGSTTVKAVVLDQSDALADALFSEAVEADGVGLAVMNRLGHRGRTIG